MCSSKNYTQTWTFALGVDRCFIRVVWAVKIPITLPLGIEQAPSIGTGELPGTAATVPCKNSHQSPHGCFHSSNTKFCIFQATQRNFFTAPLEMQSVVLINEWLPAQRNQNSFMHHHKVMIQFMQIWNIFMQLSTINAFFLLFYLVPNKVGCVLNQLSL